MEAVFNEVHQGAGDTRSGPPHGKRIGDVFAVTADRHAKASGVGNLLNGLDTTRSSTGGGTLWDIAQATSGESPDFIATESHFVVDAPCPTTLAEETCAIWISTNYTFGAARILTLDAASHLGVVAP